MVLRRVDVVEFRGMRSVRHGTMSSSLQVPISRMEAYHQDRCEWMTKTDPLSDTMGLRSWDLPLGFEALKGGACGRYKDGDVRGLSNFGYALPVPPSAGLGNQSSGDFSVQAGSPGASYSSGTSYDCNSTGNVDSAEDVSLSSYLMDGNVRAMLKKVTVNEGALNQAIQLLGGGEKGLKELMGHIMIWVKEHNGENCDKFFSSQNLKKVHPPHQQVNPAFGCASTMANTSRTFNSTPRNGPYDQRNDRVNHTFDAVQSSDEPLDLNPFYQRAKLRRLMDDGEVDSCIRSDIHSGTHGTTFVDVRGSIPDEFRFPKLEVSTGSPNSIGQVMPSGMPRELDIQQPVPCLQSSLSFPSGQDDLSRTLAATTRAARRNRIARQRQSVQQSHPRTPSNGTAVSAGCGLWSVAPPALDLKSAGMYHPGTQPVPASSARKVCNMDMLTFLLQKELRPSDVGNLGRIILPKKEAELHLPILALREGVSLQMEDFDSGYCWNIRYRFWPNNKSRMYLLENTGEFVKSHYLEEGDLLILYRNQQGGYVLRGKKKVHSENRGAQELQKRNAHSLARGFPEAPSKFEEVLQERDFGMEFDDRSGLRVKAEPTDLVGDDDPFFKDDLMRNSHSSFGQGLLQPLERFPSLNLDFPLDEIIAGIHKDDQDTANLGTKVAVVPKTEPAG